MSFVNFLIDSKLGAFPEMSPPQRVLAKVIDNQPLTTRKEIDLFHHHTGRDYLGPEDHKFILNLCGRRSGKSRIIANMAVYQAILGGHEKYLSPGETGVFLVAAQDKKVAQGVIFNYCKQIITQSPLLRSHLIGDPVSEAIRLKVDDKDIEIRVQAADKASIRGWTVIGFIGDEAAQWRFEGVNVDKQILDAVVPGATTIPNAKFCLVTTPWIKQGLVWDIFKKDWGKKDGEWFIFRASTMEMNPNLHPRVLKEIDKLRDVDGEAYRREYLAEFTDPIHGWLPGAVIDGAVDDAVKERPYRSQFTYVGAMDPAFANDAYTFVICHRNEQDDMEMDVVRRWVAEAKGKTVDQFKVMADISELCKKYGVKTLYTDQYSSEVIIQNFERSSAWQQSRARLEKIYVTATEKREEFNTLKHLILNGKMHLLDHEPTLKELKNLEVKERQGGGCIIQAPRLAGFTDDIACALAMASHYCYSKPPKADLDWEAHKVDQITSTQDYFYAQTFDLGLEETTTWPSRN